MKSYELKNEKTLFIREAREEDADEIIKYIKMVANESDFLTFGANEFNRTVDKQRELIEKANNTENYLFIIAEVEGEVVGNLNFKGGERSRTKHRGKFGVSVLKKYWGNGIGTKLLKYLIDWAKNKQIIKKINLNVRKDNKSAIELYKKFDFKKEGVITKYFYVNGKYYDSILMGLEL